MPACKTATWNGRKREGGKGRKFKKRYATVQDAVSDAIVLENIFPHDFFSVYKCPSCGWWHVGRSSLNKPPTAPTPRFDEIALLERGERALIDEDRENHHPHDSRIGWIKGKAKQAEAFSQWGDNRRYAHGEKRLSKEQWVERFKRKAGTRGFILQTSRIKPPKEST